MDQPVVVSMKSDETMHTVATTTLPSKKSKMTSGAAPAPRVPSQSAGPVEHCFRQCLRTRVFAVISFLALLIALFGGSLMVLCAVPDSPGVIIQDITMIVVTAFFLVEILMKGWAEKCTYFSSFFFWMDLLGTFSMVFEISYLLGDAGKIDTRSNTVNTVLLRAARASKVGARAGRISKVAKVFRFINRQEQIEQTVANEARVLNNRLVATMSSRMAVLTIVLVIGVPILNSWRFPVDDLSLKTWVHVLEVDYANIMADMNADSGLISVQTFKTNVEALKDFYGDQWYHPYRIQGFPASIVIDNIPRSIPGEDFLDYGKPVRDEFIVKQEVKDCRKSRPGCIGSNEAASIYFNFAQSKRIDAAMDMALIVFVVFAMGVQSADLIQTLDRMVVKPVEGMLGNIMMMAKVLQLTCPGAMNQYRSQQEITDEDMEEVAAKAKSNTVSEAELLETVFAKLAKMTAVFMQSSLVDEAEMSSLDYESRGVLLEILHMDQVGHQVKSVNRRSSQNGEHELFVPNLQVEASLIEGWQLDLLGMTRDVQTQVLTYIAFDSKVGRVTGATWMDIETWSNFLHAVRTGYLTNPYHNFIHACDVLAVVFRFMLMVKAIDWLTDVDLTAMIVAALCHDIGHAGKTNAFLVETGHELAMRYNDKSPLENMHCAKLFEMIKEPLLNVLERFNKESHKQARKVCVNVILHTDNALHFDLVKEIKKMYETNAEVCDGQCREGSEKLQPDYLRDVLEKDIILWLKLLLHMADISTPLKPFWISKQWATRVQDEFFAQGDEEKRLGLPVGMLNDRDKVNRAGSEHGFINFLVAPLMYPAVGLFPGLHPMLVQMCENMDEWKTLWVDTGPSSDDIKKREEDIQKVRDKVDELKERALQVKKRKTVIASATMNSK